MEQTKLIQLFINIHAALGGFALLTGAIALIAKKGNSAHKKAGKAFYNSMLASALIALVISILPEHENPFLFSIGIFSLYFLVSGFRSLRFKQKGFDLKIDTIIANMILVSGMCMIAIPLAETGKLNMVLLVFGSIGIIFGMRDLNLFKAPESLPNKWMKLHLGKMTGGYIAAVTAFFVVNGILPGVFNWFVPGLLGGAYITYWFVKLGK